MHQGDGMDIRHVGERVGRGNGGGRLVPSSDYKSLGSLRSPSFLRQLLPYQNQLFRRICTPRSLPIMELTFRPSFDDSAYKRAQDRAERAKRAKLCHTGQGKSGSLRHGYSLEDVLISLAKSPPDSVIVLADATSIAVPGLKTSSAQSPNDAASLANDSMPILELPDAAGHLANDSMPALETNSTPSPNDAARPLADDARRVLETPSTQSPNDAASSLGGGASNPTPFSETRRTAAPDAFPCLPSARSDEPSTSVQLGQGTGSPELLLTEGGDHSETVDRAEIPSDETDEVLSCQWEIDKIVDEIIGEDGTLFYVVAWETTIEPADNLEGMVDVIEEWEARKRLQRQHGRDVKKTEGARGIRGNRNGGGRVEKKKKGHRRS